MPSFRTLLKDLDDELRSEEVEYMKFLCETSIKQKKRLQDISDGFQLFELLEQQGLISQTNLSFLTTLLKVIERADLIDSIVSFGHTACENSSFVCPFRIMLVTISEELTDAELKSLRFLYAHYPVKRTLKNGIELFKVMMQHQKLLPENLTMLEDMLSDINRMDILEDIIKVFKVKNIINGSYCWIPPYKRVSKEEKEPAKGDVSSLYSSQLSMNVQRSQSSSSSESSISSSNNESADERQVSAPASSRSVSDTDLPHIENKTVSYYDTAPILGSEHQESSTQALSKTLDSDLPFPISEHAESSYKTLPSQPDDLFDLNSNSSQQAGNDDSQAREMAVVDDVRSRRGDEENISSRMMALVCSETESTASSTIHTGLGNPNLYGLTDNQTEDRCHQNADVRSPHGSPFTPSERSEEESTSQSKSDDRDSYQTCPDPMGSDTTSFPRSQENTNENSIGNTGSETEPGARADSQNSSNVSREDQVDATNQNEGILVTDLTAVQQLQNPGRRDVGIEAERILGQSTSSDPNLNSFERGFPQNPGLAARQDLEHSYKMNAVPRVMTEPFISHAPSFNVAHLKATCVTTFTRLPTEGEQEEDYDTDLILSGYCVIINNSHFDRDPRTDSGIQLKTREGSRLDEERLEKTFKRLHFSTIVKRDLSDAEMIECLSYFAELNHEPYDCFVCCLLSHGGEGYVYGSNGQRVAIRYLTNLLCGSNCRTLSGKPKLFFFACCQGKEEQTGTIEEDSASIGSQESSIPNAADILIGYATLPGYASYRSTMSGTWYIQELTRILDNYAHREDLQSLLTMVNHAVAKHDYFKEVEGQKTLRKQIPAPQHTLRKKVWFLSL